MQSKEHEALVPFREARFGMCALEWLLANQVKAWILLSPLTPPSGLGCVALC